MSTKETYMRSIRTRKARTAVPFVVAAVALAMSSVAYACTTMGGQTYLEMINNAPAGAGPYSAAAGSTIEAYATGVTELDVDKHYSLMEDPSGSYCMPGAADIGDPAGYGRGSNGRLPATADTFATGTLKTGSTWIGVMQICFSDTSNAAWPVDITVS